MLPLDMATTTPRARTNRRTHDRHAVWFPVQVDADELGVVVGVTKDVSAKGMLLRTNADLWLGTPVTLTFRVTLGSEPLQVLATVVRDVDDDDDWPFTLAVEFDEALEGLEEPLRGAAAA